MKTSLLLLLVTLLALAGCRSTVAETPPPGNGGLEGVSPESPRQEPDRSKLYYELDQYTTRYMEARADSDPGTWKSLHEAVLRPLVDKHIEELKATSANPDERAYRRIAARSLGFGSNPELAVPSLIAALKAEDVFVVNGALVSLYLLAWPPTPIDPVVAHLQGRDSDLRNNAALALGRILRARRRSGVERPQDDVRAASGRLVYIVSDTEEDEFVRAHAAAALGETGDPAAVDVLVNLLGDYHSVVRIKSAEGLGQLAQVQAIPPLIEAMEDAEDNTERRVIGAALEKISLSNGHPCNAQVLGTEPENWRGWYLSITR